MKRTALTLPRLTFVLLIPVLAIGLTASRALDETVVPEATCPSCDDFNPCSVDSCDTSTGTCRHAPLDCDDGNSCTTDSCEMAYPGSGGCSHHYLDPGTNCDDGNPCTASDTCSSLPGLQCTGQVQPPGTTCEDGNPCTASDVCDADGQCIGTPSLPGSSCDDQSLCTSHDTCVTSSDGALVCQGTTTLCNDLDLCSQDLCDPATGQCNHPPVNCNDGNLCTDDSCDPAIGACMRTNRNMACSNGDPCTTGQVCSGGNCIGGMSINCDDNISCTTDQCSRLPYTYGTCTHMPINSLCGYNNYPCAYWVCDPRTGGCINFLGDGPGECDFNPCTSDLCVGGDCFGTPNTKPCNDHNACTINDRCYGGGCGGSPTWLCDDGNPCTYDLCDIANPACSYVNRTGGCSDGDTCTVGDTCSNGICQGGATGLNCDDGNPCTADSCSANGTDCVHTDACDDGNVCTTDSCDPTSGACAHANNTDPCDDGNLCTVGDLCSNGACLRGQPKCGTVDGCRSTCLAGHCYYSDGPCVDDSNPCTQDICHTFAGCVHPAVTTHMSCGIGVCQRTVGTCVNGHPQSCVPGTPTDEECNGLDDDCNGLVDEGTVVLCDDSNPCTVDACSGIPGCGHTPLADGTSCSDGSACTGPSTCRSGICMTGPPLGDPTAEICNGLDDDCDGTVDDLGMTACGVGSCARAVENCVNGTQQTCVPGTPTPEVCNGIDDDCDGQVDENRAQEVCNGIDDDCDGLVDENRVQADCVISPTTLNLDSQGGMVALTCKLWDVCDPANPVSIPGPTVSQVYVSRADSADSSSDDVTLPDPSTLPCPDPDVGSLYERGISEDLTARDVSHANVTFKFDQPSDGDCSTLDGHRADFAARLTAIPDNTSATICISGKADGTAFQACVLMLVRNK